MLSRLLSSFSTSVPDDSPLTVPPRLYWVAAQVTATFETFAPAVPLPLATVQVCPAGCVSTVTAYALPLLTAVGNVKAPFDETERLPPPLFCSTTVPPRPVTLPPMVYVTGGVLPPPPDPPESPPPQAASAAARSAGTGRRMVLKRILWC